MTEFPGYGYVMSGGRWWRARTLNGSIVRSTGLAFDGALDGWLSVRDFAGQISGERSPWVYGWEPCPYCAAECHCDTVDVGVGVVQCGPYHCQECGASEIGPYDEKRGSIRPEELLSGWYEPGSEPGSSANVIGGQIVSHEEALAEYRALYPFSTTDEGREAIRSGKP